MGETGIPAGEVSGVIEDPGAHLQEQLGALRGPAHLLFCDHLDTIWLTADSTNEVEMVSPARWRSP